MTTYGCRPHYGRVSRHRRHRSPLAPLFAVVAAGFVLWAVLVALVHLLVVVVAVRLVLAGARRYRRRSPIRGARRGVPARPLAQQPDPTDFLTVEDRQWLASHGWSR